MAEKSAVIQGEALDDLVDRCLAVAERKGRILGRNGSKVLSYLSMEYQSDYGKIAFQVISSTIGNGSYNVEVKRGRNIVFKAYGNYTSGPYNNQAEKYVPGNWENKLKDEYERVKKKR